MQLSRDDLKRAYKSMFTIRTFEERVDKEFALGNIPGFAHVYLGQEASGVGVCFDLTDDDYIGSTHRGHGHCIAKGCDVHGMMLEIMGKAGGLCGGKGGSMHIADMSKGMLGANAIVGGSPPIAVGAALTQKLKKTGRGRRGVLRRRRVQSGHDLRGPEHGGGAGRAGHLRVREQRLWRAHRRQLCGRRALDRRAGPQLRHAGRSGRWFRLLRGASGHGPRPGAGRAGEGPYALEIVCSRFIGHFLGDPQAYRLPEELAQARGNDPLPRFRKGVTEASLLDQADLDAIEAEVLAEVEDAVAKGHGRAAPGHCPRSKQTFT